MAVYEKSRKDPKTGQATRWWAAQIDGKGPDGEKRRLLRFAQANTRDNAIVLEAQLHEELEAGRKKAAAAPTLQELSGEFLDHVEQNLELATLTWYRILLKRYLLPAFGNLRLTAIEGAKIDRFKDKMRKDGFSIRTLNAALTALVTILNFAVDRKYIDSRPRIRRLKRAEQPPKFFTEEERGRLLEAAKASDPEAYAVILTLYVTGMRIGQLLGLQWADVDLEKQRVHIHQAVSMGR